MVVRVTTDLAAVATDRLSLASTLVGVADVGPGRVGQNWDGGSGDPRDH